MDIRCSVCGEPWDYAGILPALKGREEEADMSKEEAERFMRGEGCPCCDFGQKCPLCRGTGKEMCPNCFGTGEWWVNGEKIGTCPQCGGAGYLDVPCEKCGGTGKPTKDEKIRIAHFEDLITVCEDDPQEYFE